MLPNRQHRIVAAGLAILLVLLQLVQQVDLKGFLVEEYDLELDSDSDLDLDDVSSEDVNDNYNANNNNIIEVNSRRAKEEEEEEEGSRNNNHNHKKKSETPDKTLPAVVRVADHQHLEAKAEERVSVHELSTPENKSTSTTAPSSSPSPATSSPAAMNAKNTSSTPSASSESTAATEIITAMQQQLQHTIQQQQQQQQQPLKQQTKQAIIESTHQKEIAKQRANDTDGIYSCNSTDRSVRQCCGTWDGPNSDDWWTHNPQWVRSEENATHYCFDKIANEEHSKFLQSVYALQWPTTTTTTNTTTDHNNCSNVVKSVDVNSGFGHVTQWLTESFFYAIEQQRPFQVVQTERKWLYATGHKNHSQYCDSEDVLCFYLPVSSCDRLENTNIRNEHYVRRPTALLLEERLQFHWVRQYLFRPNHEFRRRIVATKQQVDFQVPCTTMHVRRGDAGLPRPPFRRYAAVQEYLDRLPPDRHATRNILLLTDDQTTIDEIQKHLRGVDGDRSYHWMYLDRPRNHGIDGGFHGHTPSGDPVADLVAIYVELELAKQCQQIVHGQSGFMKALVEDMELENATATLDKYYVDTAVDKADAQIYGSYRKDMRVADFLRDIEAVYANKKRNKENNNTLNGVSQASAFSKTQKKPKDPLNCGQTGSDGGTVCCSKWNVNVDDWWLHRPSWEVVSENRTKQCFAPMKDEKQATFYQNLYDLQWNGNCSEVVSSTQINSGFSASTYWLAYSFLYASQEKRPFQILEHDTPWLYGPQNDTSWAYCDSKDIACYYLPISNCPRQMVPRKTELPHLAVTPEQNPKGEQEFQWIKDYMMRPKQAFRQKVMEMQESLHLEQPCTTMHVRRGDSGLPRTPYRRYAAVQEYLDAATVEENTTIMLLTDDQTTIDEIHQYHPNYKWVYLDRKRNSGIDGGWESHVPSGDGPAEVVAIYAETELATHCQKVVHGKSGFMKHVRGRMAYLGIEHEAFVVNTGVSIEEGQKWPKEERLEHFMKEMEEYRNMSNAKKQGASNTTANSIEMQAPAISSKSPSAPSKGKLADIVSCSQSKESSECCTGWDINLDDWWLQNPSWEVASENRTMQCFSPMKDAVQSTFFQNLHNLQWGGNCSEAIYSTQINSGFSASTFWLAYVFLKATQEEKPFQILIHDDSSWLYGPQNKTNWAYCDTEDIGCLYLPVSNCPRKTIDRHAARELNLHRNESKPERDPKSDQEFNWIRDYMMRPKQILRQKVMAMQDALHLEPPCTTLHVRRGDSGLPRQPFRRYAAVQEYLDAGDVAENTTIMLLTDDQTTIDEIHKYHPNYNWVYLERKRHSGVEGGWESHVPSGDGPSEVAVIYAETELAIKCLNIVQGRSGFMKHVRGKMTSLGIQHKATVLPTGVSKEEAQKWPGDGKERMEFFMKEMEEYRKASNAKKQESSKN